MEWPEIVELRDVVITPMVTGNSKQRMALRADPQSSLLGHFRYGLPESFMDILPVDPGDAETAQVIDEPIIYAGPLFRHFGHALSESIHRLWPRFALRELNDAKVAFAPIHNTKIMPWVTAALNLHGLPRRQAIRIDTPMRFTRLLVGPQARQMAGPTIIPDYQEMLDRSLELRLGPPARERRLYVSRMHHHHTGSFYGESYVEAALREHDFEIIYPEQHHLTELVAMLRASSIAIFAEGSAIHALELCGSATPDVFVIGRRGRSVDRFEPLLSDICRRWTVSDRLLLNAGMSDDPKKHSGIVNLAAVVGDLWQFAGLPGARAIDRDDLAAAVRRDLQQHIDDERNERSADYEARARQLTSIVRASTFAEPQAANA